MNQPQHDRDVDTLLDRQAQANRAIAAAERHDPDKWLIVWGWIGALLLAPVGAIIGIILITRNRLGHGIAQLVISVGWIWLMFVALAPAANAAPIGHVTSTASGLARTQPFPDWVTVKYEPCPFRDDVAGCADPDAAIVYSATRSRFVVWHEIGHVFDRQRLTDADRAWFTAMLGFALGAQWSPANDEVGTTPTEYFADAYAACAMGRSPAGERRGRVIIDNWPAASGYRPTVREHRRVCRAIADV